MFSCRAGEIRGTDPYRVGRKEHADRELEIE
jgi:hypothetical protein